MMDTDLEKVIPQLNTKMKFDICCQISKAINYLHSFNPPILHRDIKPSNILINKKGKCKLSGNI